MEWDEGRMETGRRRKQLLGQADEDDLIRQKSGLCPSTESRSRRSQTSRSRSKRYGREVDIPRYGERRRRSCSGGKGHL